MARLRIRGSRLGLVFVLALAGFVGLASSTSVQAGGGSGPTSAQAGGGCTNASLRGAFGFKETGISLTNGATTGTFAIVGRNVFDGKGGFTGTGTASFNGTIVPITTQGTYTVQPNCTGSQTGVANPGGNTFHRDFVLVDGGKQAFFISTDPNSVDTGQGISIPVGID